MDISIIGLCDPSTIYSVVFNNKIVNLKNNHKFSINLDKYSYFKIIYQNNIRSNTSNFIQFTYKDNFYPIIFNPSWNAENIDNVMYSENFFMNLKNYHFQQIDDIDKINQLNCLCSDLTRPYFLPKIEINIADHYKFIFDNWTGNNQIWLSNNNSAFACLLLGLNKCYLTVSLKLPYPCDQDRYDFYSEYSHDTPHDELFRLDCFELKPEFTYLKPINFPILLEENCDIDINKFQSQISIKTHYTNV